MAFLEYIEHLNRTLASFNMTRLQLPSTNKYFLKTQTTASDITCPRKTENQRQKTTSNLKLRIQEIQIQTLKNDFQRAQNKQTNKKRLMILTLERQ